MNINVWSLRLPLCEVTLQVAMAQTSLVDFDLLTALDVPASLLGPFHSILRHSILEVLLCMCVTPWSSHEQMFIWMPTEIPNVVGDNEKKIILSYKYILYHHQTTTFVFTTSESTFSDANFPSVGRNCSVVSWRWSVPSVGLICPNIQKLGLSLDLFNSHLLTEI